jgi:hypothetical protein
MDKLLIKAMSSRIRRAQWALIAAFAVLTVGAGVRSSVESWQRGAGASTYNLASELVIPESALDIGAVLDLRSVSRLLPITNVGASLVECRFLASCNCTSMVPSELLLQPSETRLATVTVSVPNPTFTPRPLACSLSPGPLASRVTRLRLGRSGANHRRL